MKKNKAMRLASVLLVLVLMTSSVVGGTFAKYTSTASGTDTARVAYWGFGQDSEIAFTDLFVDVYNTGKIDSVGDTGDDVIAPGAFKHGTFKFAYTNNTNISATAPEVAYDFTVSIEGSEIDDDIKRNTNIQWVLVDATDGVPAADSDKWGTWDKLMTDILQLSGDKTATYKADDPTTHKVVKNYGANTAPEAFAQNKEWIVAWQWKFEGGSTNYGTAEAPIDQNAFDTAMGNKATLDDVKIFISITATQVN